MNSGLNSDYFKKIVAIALKEDLGEEGDITSRSILAEEIKARAEIVSGSKGLVAGIPLAQEVFRQVDSGLVFEKLVEEGERIEIGTVIAKVEGSTKSILAAERTALNFLQHLSGIATLTARYVEEVRGFPVRIMDTRKTHPGLRPLEKYAVSLGGGLNHRFGLYDAVLIKDNHIKSVGGVREAVERARANLSPGTQIEVEVEDREELAEALELGVEVIMLDNWTPQEMGEMVKLVAGRAKLEASGGVNLGNVREIARSGVDFISVGELTHSAPALDFKLELA